MTFPLLSNTYVDPELVTSANLYSRVLAVINTLGGFMYGDTQGGATVNFTTGGANFAMTDSKVTFTLTAQRRVRVTATYVASCTAATVFKCFPAVVAGSAATLSGATLGPARQLGLSITGGPGQTNVPDAETTFLLAAGTWSAFAVGQGNTTAGSGLQAYCGVYDSGNV